MPGDNGEDGVRSLRLMLDERGEIPWREAVEIGARVSRALEQIHRAGRVHGSIRPDTVLIDDRDSVRIKETERSATDDTEIVTTSEAAYFSPEQAQALEFDQRSDLYSLGIVLFEMLTGTVPFDAPSANAAAYRQVNKPPPRLELDPDVPSRVAEIVDRALAKDPEDRYQSGGQMATALEGAVTEHTATATAVAPSRTSEEVRTSVDPAPRQGWRRLALASILLLVSGIATAGLFPMPSSEETTQISPAVDTTSEDDAQMLDSATAPNGTFSRNGPTGPRPGVDDPDSNGNTPKFSATTTSSATRSSPETPVPSSPTTTALTSTPTSPTTTSTTVATTSTTLVDSTTTTTAVTTTTVQGTTITTSLPTP